MSPSAKVQRVQMLKVTTKYSVSDLPILIKQILANLRSVEFMQAFAAEIQTQKDMNSFTEYLDNPKDIKKGSLLASKAIFNIVYNPNDPFKNYEAPLVACSDMLHNLHDPDRH
jgi:hypothetical protein